MLTRCLRAHCPILMLILIPEDPNVDNHIKHLNKPASHITISNRFEWLCSQHIFRVWFQMFIKIDRRNLSQNYKRFNRPPKTFATYSLLLLLLLLGIHKKPFVPTHPYALCYVHCVWESIKIKRFSHLFVKPKEKKPQTVLFSTVLYSYIHTQIPSHL